MSAWIGNPCRLCLQGDSLISIPDDPLYLYAVFDASGVKVSPRDELPQQLCDQCFLFIKKCNTFRNKCLETQKTLLDMINKRKNLPNTVQNNIEIENLSILPNVDDSLEIVDEKIENVDIQDVYHIGDLITDNEQLNAENRDVFGSIPNLNLNTDNLNQRSEELKQSNEHLNSVSEDFDSDNEDLGSVNEVLHSDSDDLHSNNEDLNSATETLNLNNEDINQINKESHSRSKDIKEINSHSNNIVADDKAPYTATYINKKVAKCNVCEKTMVPKSIRGHLKRHEIYGKVLKKGSKMKHKQLRAECDTCGKKMPKKRLLAHFLIHDGTSGQLTCKHCDKDFDRPSRLLRHCRAKHGYQKVDKCSYCDFMGCSEYEVKIHEKAHKGGDALTCNICKKTMKWKISWEQHMATHEDPKIQCPACPEKFHTSRRLARHNLSKHCIISFHCPHCPLTSLRKSAIQTHMKRKHGATNEKDIKTAYKSQITKKIKTKAKDTNSVLNSRKKKLRYTNGNLNSRKNVKVNEKPLDTKLKNKASSNITKENLDVISDVLIQPIVDDAVQIIEIQNIQMIDIQKVQNIENLDIYDVYNLYESGTIEANIENSENSENKDIFGDIKDLNSDNINLNQDNKHLNTCHEYLNTDSKTLNQVTDNISVNNEDLRSDNEILNSSCEVLNSDFEDLNLDNEDLNPDNEDLNLSKEELNEGIQERKTNILIGNKRPDKQTHVGKAASRCNTKGPKHSRRKVDCSVCGLEVLPRSLPAHLKRHELYGENLKKRFKNYYKQPQVKCDTCDKRMPKKYFQAHFLTHDRAPGNLKCKHCDKSFDRPSRLLRHCRAKHGYQKVDKCSYCDFMGCSEYEVKLHAKRAHEGNGLSICEICGKNFKTTMGLSSHMALHNDPKILCTKCPEKFRTPKQLSIHMVNDHKSLLDSTHCFQCPHCSHITRTKRSIVIHMKKSHNATNIQDIATVLKDPSSDRLETNVKIKRSRSKVNFIKNPLSSDLLDTEENQDKVIDKNKSVNFISAFHKHLDLSNKSSLDKVDLTQGKVDLSEGNVKLDDLAKTLDADFNLQVTDLNIDTYFNVVNEVLISNCGELSANVDLNADKDLSPYCKKENADVDINAKTDYGQCNTCGESMLKQFLVQHIKLHDPSYAQTRLPKPDPFSKTVACQICERIIKQHRFKRHMQTHTNPKAKTIVCEHCGLRFDCNASLLSHCKARHGYQKTAQCSFCSYMGINAHQVKLHERVHTGERPFSCNVCQKAFHLQSIYKSHMATHDRSDKNKVECTVCKKTMFKRYYATHKKTHEPNYQPSPSRVQPRVQCPTCGATMLKHSLKSHLALHEGSLKTIACEHCDKTFHRRSRLLRHCKAIHGYEKTDKCSFCDYRGCSRTEVRLHERKHTGERAFVCSICDAAFKFPSSRQKHMAERHGKGKMVQCEVCAETFLTPRLLSSHKYTKHSTHAYSYQCALCHKVYKRRGAARRHLLKNHDEPRSIDKIIKLGSNVNQKLVDNED